MFMEPADQLSTTSRFYLPIQLRNYAAAKADVCPEQQRHHDSTIEYADVLTRKREYCQRRQFVRQKNSYAARPRDNLIQSDWFQNERWTRATSNQWRQKEDVYASMETHAGLASSNSDFLIKELHSRKIVTIIRETRDTVSFRIKYQNWIMHKALWKNLWNSADRRQVSMQTSQLMRKIRRNSLRTGKISQDSVGRAKNKWEKRYLQISNPHRLICFRLEAIWRQMLKK